MGKIYKVISFQYNLKCNHLYNVKPACQEHLGVLICLFVYILPSLFLQIINTQWYFLSSPGSLVDSFIHSKLEAHMPHQPHAYCHRTQKMVGWMQISALCRNVLAFSLKKTEINCANKEHSQRLEKWCILPSGKVGNSSQVANNILSTDMLTILYIGSLFSHNASIVGTPIVFQY